MTLQVVEVPIKGMDCADCVQTVQRALSALPGVETADVFLASEKAVLRLDPAQVTLLNIEKAVADAGYSVAKTAGEIADQGDRVSAGLTRRVLTLFGMVFALVLII